MAPIKKKLKKIDKIVKKNSAKPKKKKLIHQHPKYGTSKLEEKFENEFLKKIGVNYIYQYKMDSIGRYLDFFIPEYKIAIEIQGSYWHGDPRLYEEKDLNRTQLWDKKVDEMKKKWCSKNGIPLIYIWELDINKHPERVLSYLKEVFKKEKIKKNPKKINKN